MTFFVFYYKQKNGIKAKKKFTVKEQRADAS